MNTKAKTRSSPGLDQEQPAFGFFGAPLKEAVENGEVPLARLNDMVHRILRTEFAIGIVDRPPVSQVFDIARGPAFAQKVEEQSAVLLKSNAGQLPLNAASIASIAVIGSHADVGVLSGGGSAQVDPPGGSVVVPRLAAPADDIEALLTSQIWDPSSPLEAIRRHAPRAAVAFDPGSNLKTAARLAAHSSIAIVFLHQHTHEGNDVPTLALPDRQDELVATVAAANPHTIVVLENGGPVLMPGAIASRPFSKPAIPESAVLTPSPISCSATRRPLASSPSHSHAARRTSLAPNSPRLRVPSPARSKVRSR